MAVEVQEWRCGGQRWDDATRRRVPCRHVLLLFKEHAVQLDVLMAQVQVKCRRCGMLNGWSE